jgi:hypothetical protein
MLLSERKIQNGVETSELHEFVSEWRKQKQKKKNHLSNMKQNFDWENLKGRTTRKT